MEDTLTNIQHAPTSGKKRFEGNKGRRVTNQEKERRTIRKGRAGREMIGNVVASTKRNCYSSTKMF